MVRTTLPEQSEDRKLQKQSHVLWLTVGALQVSPRAQRRFSHAQAQKYAANFDFDAIGFPVVSRRDGIYWIVDGQHRIGALEIMGWADQKIQCEVWDDLSEAEEAELFLRRDDRTAVTTIDKYMIGLVARRPVELAINKVVEGRGLRVGKSSSSPKTITAVAALGGVYERGGSDLLRRVLTLLREGFPDDSRAFKSKMMTGMSYVAARYGSQLKDEVVIAKLLATRGGPLGIEQKAAHLHLKTDRGIPDCIAAAIVEVLNSNPGGHRLERWWN